MSQYENNSTFFPYTFTCYTSLPSTLPKAASKLQFDKSYESISVLICKEKSWNMKGECASTPHTGTMLKKICGLNFYVMNHTCTV